MRLHRLLCLLAIFPAAQCFAANLTMSAEQPDQNYHTVNIRAFADEVRTLSKGSLNITVRSNSVLLKRPEAKRGVQQGLVAIADTPLANMANEGAIFELDSIPFLASSFDASEKLWTLVRPIVTEKLDKSGLTLLYAVPWPPQGLYSKKPIASLEDVKGTKLRAINAVVARMATLMGAVPVTLPTGEVPQAFSTNVIDMMVTSSTTGVDSAAWDFSKYYYSIQATLPIQLVVFNKRSYTGLTKAEQGAVMDAAAKAEARGWAASRQEDQKSMDILKAKGMIVEPIPPVLAKEMEGIAKVLIEDWSGRADPAAKDVLTRYQQGR